MMEFVFGYFLGVIMVVAVSFNTLHKEDLEAGLNKCQNNGGLERYISNLVGSPEVFCKDGARFTIKDRE